MDSPQTPGNAPAGSTSIAEGSRHKCPQCNKTFKHVPDLSRHIKGHELKYKCRFCPKRFGRADEVPRHELFIHGRNVSSNICYLPACARMRLGMKSEVVLIQHLQHSHGGATMADNGKAKREQGYDQPQDQSQDHPIVGHEPEEEERSSVGRLSTHEPDSEDEEENLDDDVADPSQDMDVDDQEAVTLADYAAENEALREQLQQEREWHRIEIDAIRKAYTAEIEKLKARVAAGDMEHS